MKVKSNTPLRATCTVLSEAFRPFESVDDVIDFHIELVLDFLRCQQLDQVSLFIDMIILSLVYYNGHAEPEEKIQLQRPTQHHPLIHPNLQIQHQV